MWKVFEDLESMVLIGDKGVISFDHWDGGHVEYHAYPFEDADYGTIDNPNMAEHVVRKEGYTYAGGSPREREDND